jgi:hypothetical protein
MFRAVTNGTNEQQQRLRDDRPGPLLPTRKPRACWQGFRNGLKRLPQGAEHRRILELKRRSIQSCAQAEVSCRYIGTILTKDIGTNGNEKMIDNLLIKKLNFAKP